MMTDSSRKEVLMTLQRWLQRRSRVEDRLARGQALVEYAFVMVFLDVVLILLATLLGRGIVDLYQTIIDNLPFF
jgi:Flp pilus assembly pilin Flp